MTDPMDIHEPSREFSEFLARDIARTIRHDARFAPSASAIRARRIRMVTASVAVTVLVLVIGLVFGTSTGYASARAESDRRRDEMTANSMGAASQLAVLRLDLARARADLLQRANEQGATSKAVLEAAAAELHSMEASVDRIGLDLAQNRRSAAPPPAAFGSVPVKRALSVTCNALSLDAAPAPVTQTIPVVDLPPPSAKSSEALWNVLGVRHLSGGRVLVNDAGNRQMRLFDSTLASSTVTIDSNTYGRRPMGITAYLGDSSLFADQPSWTIRVLDGAGRIARTVALPDMQLNLAGPSYVDDKGRVLYTGRADWGVRSAVGDSISILRIDLASGRVDTVGRVKNRDGLGYALKRADTARYWFSASLGAALVPARDDWAVLSDGSIAFVRGHDYHIDWLRADGTRMSTPKLPFDWQRLADESRMQGAVDSVRAAAISKGKPPVWIRAGVDTALTRAVRLEMMHGLNTFFERLSLGGSSAVIPDAVGNLWILPTMPADAQNAALVYDVVNSKGELFRRVRVPQGKSIAGFGKGGIVYLLSGDRRNGLYLERTKLP